MAGYMYNHPRVLSQMNLPPPPICFTTQRTDDKRGVFPYALPDFHIVLTITEYACDYVANRSLKL